MFKRYFAIFAVALTLGGCTSAGGLLDIAQYILNPPPGVLTAVANPVTPVDIHRVNAVYAEVREIAADWRDYCYSKPYKALIADPILGAPLCRNRRRTVLAIAKADLKVEAAIAKAEDFIAKNPTLSAVTVVTAAWNALQDYQRIAQNATKTVVTK